MAYSSTCQTASTHLNSAKQSTVSNEKERRQALGQVLTHIERNFGQGSIMRLGTSERFQVETFTSGALPLDIALGGGLPKGRVIEIFGPESSGKTTLALHVMHPSKPKAAPQPL